MATFDQIHSGRVLTHLTEIFELAGADLSTRRPNLQQITNRLKQDPVYQAISSEEFVCPVRRCPQADRLQKTIQTIQQLIEGSKDYSMAFGPFLYTVENFLEQKQTTWKQASGYFLVPVIDVAGDDERPGLFYLRSLYKPSSRNVARRRFSIEDLTQEPRLIEYFDSLAVVLLKNFYFVKDYPRDPYIGLADYSYRLHFGCQITEGKSVGAAAIAMFALTYLQNMLGKTRYLNVVAPQVGTLLTGEVDADGRVLPVGQLEQKVRCAVDEYGSELKVIVPNKEPLPAYLESRINRRNLFYVGTVEELLAAVLSARGDSRGLDKAREAVFQSLPREEKDELVLHLLPEVPPDIYDRGCRWAEPVPHEQGIYSITNAWNERFDISIAPDRFTMLSEEDTHAERKLIQVILDASEAMDGYWVADPQTRISKVASVLFHIASCIDPAREDLVVGTLSHPHFEKVEHGAIATDLHSLLNQIRDQNGLRSRGSFMRPVRQASIQQYANRRKRIYVISESFIPDLYDLEDLRVEVFEMLRFSPVKGNTERAVFSEDWKTNQGLINSFFQKQSATMPEIQIDIGTDLPVEWEPMDAVISRQEDRYVMKWKDEKALKWSFRVRLANQYPHQIKVSGQLNRNGLLSQYSFMLFPTITSLPPLRQTQQGELDAEELKKWKTICSPELSCADCKENSSLTKSIHIFHESEWGLSKQMIFPNLEKLKDGWLVLCENQPQWVFFQTGCQVEGISVAVVDDRLQYSEAEGYLEPVPDSAADEFYRLQTPGHVYYMTHIE